MSVVLLSCAFCGKVRGTHAMSRFAAVCDLAGKVYVVGGWNGQCGMKQSNAFDPAGGKWSSIAPLNCGNHHWRVTE